MLRKPYIISAMKLAHAVRIARCPSFGAEEALAAGHVTSVSFNVIQTQARRSPTLVSAVPVIFCFACRIITLNSKDSIRAGINAAR
jgi:hypothetical protein